MLLNLVWDRASDSPAIERTPTRESVRVDISNANFEVEKSTETGFLEKLERMFSVYSDLILKDLQD